MNEMRCSNGQKQEEVTYSPACKTVTSLVMDELEKVWHWLEV
jgi:hypothetical protein